MRLAWIAALALLVQSWTGPAMATPMPDTSVDQPCAHLSSDIAAVAEATPEAPDCCAQDCAADAGCLASCLAGASAPLQVLLQYHVTSTPVILQGRAPVQKLHSAYRVLPNRPPIAL